MLCSLSIGPLSGLAVMEKPLFDLLDIFSSNFLLLFGSVMAVLLVGWKMSREDVWDEFTNSGSLRTNVRIFRPLYFIIKYVTPLALVAIFISNFIF